VLSYLYIQGDISFGATDRSDAVAETDPNSGILGAVGLTTNIPTIMINNTTAPPQGLVGFWSQATSNAATNPTTLLHELGHVLDFLGWTGDKILNDSTSDQTSENNDALITSKCAKYFQ
jgi:hypothetical protein